jgi:hypothetical protein
VPLHDERLSVRAEQRRVPVDRPGIDLLRELGSGLVEEVGRGEREAPTDRPRADRAVPGSVENVVRTVPNRAISGNADTYNKP